LFDVTEGGEIFAANPKRDEMTACSFGSQGRRLDLVPVCKSASLLQRDWVVGASFTATLSLSVRWPDGDALAAVILGRLLPLHPRGQLTPVVDGDAGNVGISGQGAKAGGESGVH